MPLRRSWDWAAVGSAGAALGWWMFHYRGAALFAGVGLAAALGFHVLSRHSRRIAAALALGGGAFALYASSTLGWAGTDVPDGSRFKASPVGLSHVLTPDQLEFATIDCGWYAVSGYGAPCAVADAGAFARLRTVYPLVMLAALLAVAAAGLSLGRSSGAERAQRLLGGASGLAAFAGLILFAVSVRPALAEVADLPVGVGGTLGTMQLALALLLCLTVVLGSIRQPERAALSTLEPPLAPART
jgi:hypothetical protein